MALPSFIGSDIQSWLNSFQFKTPIKTRFSETDAFGHINNVSYFTYFEQARIDYFEHLKIFEALNIEKSSEHIVVTANLECHYISQLFYGQFIDVYVKTSKIGRSSFDLEYAILDQHSKNLAAIGRGAIVYINKETGKSEELPEAFKDTLSAFEKLVNHL